MKKPMRRIGITQRVMFLEKIRERRDCLDQRWYLFAGLLGVDLLPLPNRLQDPAAYARRLQVDALIFSGGNDLASEPLSIDEDEALLRQGIAIERDFTENQLLKMAAEDGLPVVGVCRGLQAINQHFGGRLSRVSAEQHVAVTHSVRFLDRRWQECYGETTVVNSYHNWGVQSEGLAAALTPVAVDEDGFVEALRHNQHPIYGVMWHPERENPFSSGDVKSFRRILGITAD